MRVLDGSDINENQMKALGAYSVAPDRAIQVTMQKLGDEGLSDAEVNDLVDKGYLEALSNGDYLIPKDVDWMAIAKKLREPANKELIREMFSEQCSSVHLTK